MSLLDAARRVLLGNVSVHLVHDPEHGATYVCLHCSTRVLYSSGEGFTHAEDCPALAMPQIVAALEAAEAVADAVRHPIGDRDEAVDALATAAHALANFTLSA